MSVFTLFAVAETTILRTLLAATKVLMHICAETITGRTNTLHVWQWCHSAKLLISR